MLNPATRTAQKSAVRVVYPAAMAAMVEKVAAEREAGARVAGKIALVAPASTPGQAASEEMHKRHAEVVAQAGGGGALRPSTVSGAGAPRTEVASESLGPQLHDGHARAPHGRRDPETGARAARYVVKNRGLSPISGS